MVMKHIVLVLFFFVSSCIMLSAQDMTAEQIYDTLQSYEWISHDDELPPVSYTFSSTVFHYRIFKTAESNYEGNKDYYLSDTADTEFVASKMGHAQGSRYIVRRDRGNRTSWLEIVTITPEHLTLRSSSNVLLEFSAQPKQGGNSPE